MNKQPIYHQDGTIGTIDDVIAGAIFDFAGKVTSGEQEFSGHHEAGPMVELIQAWAAERELDIEQALVQDWQAHRQFNLSRPLPEVPVHHEGTDLVKRPIDILVECCERADRYLGLMVVTVERADSDPTAALVRYYGSSMPSKERNRMMETAYNAIMGEGRRWYSHPLWYIFIGALIGIVVATGLMRRL